MDFRQFRFGHRPVFHLSSRPVWASGIKAGRNILLLISCLLAPLAANASCVLDNKAVVPLQVTQGTITLAVEVNGISATFILDTGAQRSLVTQAAVQRLGLARDQWVGTTMRGIGGIDRRPNANPRSLSLAGVPLVRRTLNHDTSLTVGVLPNTNVGALVIDGLLGRDFLSLFDLDLDVPNHRLTLYQVKGCTGRFLPWNGDYNAIPASIGLEEAVILPVAVDGKPLQAILDTGASATLLGASGIYRLGLNPAALMGDRSVQISGLGPRELTVHQHRFRSMQVDNQLIDAPLLWVEPVRLQPFADMLLGEDWLARRHVWISFATKQVFTADN